MPTKPAEAEAIAAAIDKAIQQKARRDPKASFHDDDLAALRARVMGGGDIGRLRDGVVFSTFGRPELEGEGAREFLVRIFSVGFNPAKVQVRQGGRVVAETVIPRVREGRVSDHAAWQDQFIYFVTTNPDPATDFADYPWFELDRPGGSYDLVFVDAGGHELKRAPITLGP